MARGVRTITTEPAEAELLTHLAHTTPLSAGEAARVVAEVLAEFDEQAPAWVRRRHAELQAGGLRNPEILGRIAAELPARRFAAPRYSERQLRRIVYG